MKRKTLIVGGSVAALALLGFTVWYKLMCRDVAQPEWVSKNHHDLFLYGSVGTEQEAGIPYWVWLTLPRMFPEHIPGNGGYVALGMPWEQGKEMPAGFSKKRVGYIRVAGNCALCHAASYRLGPDEGPQVVPFVPGRARDIQSLLDFFRKCAEDPRFNADEILNELKSATNLQWSDYLLYKYYLIPLEQEKFVNPGAMVIDSALRRHGADPHAKEPLAQPRLKPFTDALREFQVPIYPLPLNAALVSDGKKLFSSHCGSCHAENGERTGAVVPIAEIGTDSEALKITNAKGYVARPLTGVWMRGPYLHNGSVPTVGDLLNVERPPRFFPGNNVLDTEMLGFFSNKSQEKGLRFPLYDTKETGHQNAGHLFGTTLSLAEKKALLEYLKTL